MPAIKLVRAPFSTNVERVALALAHKGLEPESIWIDYSDRSIPIEMSGQPLVPVLEYDGEVLHESMDIVRFLDERHPDPPLYPADPARRAEMDVFIEWFNRVWKVPPNEIDAGEGEAEELSLQMRVWQDLFERMLDSRDFLMGAELSAADICAFPFLKYTLLLDPEDPDTFHHVLVEHLRDGVERPWLEAWIKRVEERPRA
jgi:maleylacetoacetate isomerase/maleylpyruvate isomerase